MDSQQDDSTHDKTKLVINAAPLLEIMSISLRYLKESQNAVIRNEFRQF